MAEVPVKKSSRNIPEAKFVEDVEAYMKTRSIEAEMAQLDELHQKYKFMESNLSQRKAHLEGKLPELRANLNVLEKLRANQESGEELRTHFELADNMFVQATVPAVDTVSLWLGANVMLEYTLDEAETLLGKNYAATKASVADLAQDMAFCREQITTTEVNIARIYNWNVRKNREQRAQ